MRNFVFTFFLLKANLEPALRTDLLQGYLIFFATWARARSGVAATALEMNSVCSAHARQCPQRRERVVEEVMIHM